MTVVQALAVTKLNQLLDNALMQDSTVMKNNVQKFDASNAMQIKAQSLETRVDKMMQEMDNVQKLMHMPLG